MPNLNYSTLAAFGIALVATLVLAALLTPASWWRRPNLRALAVVALGTWGIGTLLLGFASTPTPAMAAATPAAPGQLLPGAGVRYRVADDLNLRTAKGTSAPRIAVVPAGQVVTATGVRDGDWWRLRAQVDGREVEGWSSSLWLRRVGE